jgi:hypothetical protein
MNTQLIEGQSLIESFLNMIPSAQTPIQTHKTKSIQTGSINFGNLPIDVQRKLFHLTDPINLVDQKYKALFDGDLSQYEYDHSSADMALIRYFCNEGLSEQEADLAFRCSKLYRDKWDELRGSRTYGEITLSKAFESNSLHTQNMLSKSLEAQYLISANPSDYRPIFVPTGMPPRIFAGPKINDNARLFPMQALSSLVALGGIGKTSLLMTLGAHVAAGKSWNGHELQRRKVAIFLCEESQEEISRKFSAITENWLPNERLDAEENLLTVPLIGKDARLTSLSRNQYQGSEIAEEIIQLLQNFQLENGLVILDHMQGFSSGDLNISETATAICREANKIVNATGSAVVMAAHIGKNNIKANDIEQGFAVGSLAFENAARQMSGMIPMQEDEAKKYGLIDQRKDYVWLGLAKNSYGSSNGGLWLKKVYNPRYNTVVYEPIKLAEPSSMAKQSSNERLARLILERIDKYPFTTKNMIDGLAGKNGLFKASKEKIRDCLRGLIDQGEIYEHTVTEEERQEYGVAKQVKAVLRLSKAAGLEARQ